jgi:hypothetical protein
VRRIGREKGGTIGGRMAQKEDEDEDFGGRFKRMEKVPKRLRNLTEMG